MKRHKITQVEIFTLVNQSYGELWLPNADLRGLDLSGAYLYRACLRGSDLGKLPPDPKDGRIEQETDLSGADLRYANLCGTVLSEADLGEARLNYANLRQADLRGTYLWGGNLGEADLRGAKLDLHTNLCEASLKEADLRGVDLTGIDLELVDLRETKIDAETKFDDKWRLVREIANRREKREKLDEAGRQQEAANFQPELYGLPANGLDNANLFGADLSGLNLSNLNLRQVDLRETDIEGAQFCSVGGLVWKLVNPARSREKSNKAEWLEALQAELSNLTEDDLNNVSLRGADLRGLDLSKFNLDFVDLRETRIDEETRFCDHLDAERNPIRRIWKIMNQGAYAVKLKGDFSKANLRGCDFRGIDASEVKAENWQTALVEGLKFDDETVFAPALREEIKETLRNHMAKEKSKRKTA